ncbi:biotin transport system substrate-specific component [Fictibacillus enclensis]|uniref:Biotin transporter n=1 Tax=Fictibacillus enclensis TaxID=1017270 RepID=A0A0V8IZT7_9BACL|nr:biotin transporter BioY [Fictibacillus enclensis]KSU80326.1 BioY family transporter [Fictibacillus enclensis]SCC38078.1 biotin transport system substrate-specific component [Fictibacillus enclensis]
MDQSTRLRTTIICALFVAMTAILAQIEIPLPLVPISGQTLAVGITATILGSRFGALTMIGYMAVGAAGVPVFAEAKSGLSVIIGPTGGYIIGFIFAAFITGLLLEKTSFTLTNAMMANTAGMVITLLFGVIQLKFVVDLSWTKALAAGAYPFIVVGLIKAFLASWIGITVRSRLEKARLLPNGRVKKAV